MLWLVFAPSGLNSHSDLGGSGYKITDPAPFKLHRAGAGQKLYVNADGYKCVQSVITFGLSL